MVKYLEEVIGLKRKIALLLSVMMLVVAMIPAQVFAATNEKGLEEAIKQVKSKLTIPESYTVFTYNVNNYNEKKVWRLNWSGKDGVEGSVNASVDEKGNILNYSLYKPESYSASQKLPKFSKEQAKAIAETFINQVNPGLLSQVRYQDNSINSIQGIEFYFNYTRVVNGIPFYGNNVSVSVNRQTGEVIGYNYNWNDELKFPSAEGALSLEKAQQAYKDKIGLELQYNYTYDKEQVKPYAVFVPKSSNNPYIDAFTGEKFENTRLYFTAASADNGLMDAKMKLEAAAGGTDRGSIVLTEEEKNAIEKIAKLISKDEAEKIARNIKVLELTGEYEVKNYSLSKNWADRNEFVWRLDFQKKESNKSDYRSVNVVINAINGEVKSFNTYYEHKADETAQYDKNAAKAAAEALLKELQPAKFNETVYDENNDSRVVPYYRETEKPTQFSFAYTRKVNGIPFPGNTLRVGYDAINGKITSFDSDWFTVEFPSVEKAVSLDTVYQKMFSEIGLELQYVMEVQPVTVEKIIPAPQTQDQKVKLVYGVKQGKPVAFDANTGAIVGYDGKPYKENKPVQYTDIAGHFAESQIKVLAEYGVSLEGTEFKPDQNITQREFFTLLSKTLNYYNPYPVAKEGKEVDALYSFFLREGIIKESEKAPDAVVTREDAVKFLIRALKYDKIADLKGIFNCEFKDTDQINPELIGYVVIAKGLKIINGYDGYFNPRGQMTRAQAAVTIYNYLQN